MKPCVCVSLCVCVCVCVCACVCVCIRERQQERAGWYTGACMWVYTCAYIFMNQTNVYSSHSSFRSLTNPLTNLSVDIYWVCAVCMCLRRKTEYKSLLIHGSGCLGVDWLRETRCACTQNHELVGQGSTRLYPKRHISDPGQEYKEFRKQKGGG